jgi:hypothetical protein
VLAWLFSSFGTGRELARGGTWIHATRPRSVRVCERTRQSLSTSRLARQIDIDAVEDRQAGQRCRALHRQFETIRIETQVECRESTAAVPPVCAPCWQIEPLLRLFEEQGAVELNYPPDYPKMPGEPPRVQPSKKVAAHWDEDGNRIES